MRHRPSPARRENLIKMRQKYFGKEREKEIERRGERKKVREAEEVP